MFRLTALLQCNLRKFVGPRLTEDEKNTPYFGCRPLSNPRFFLLAIVSAKIVLFFMILFTFTVLAPLTCCVTAFAFLVMEIGYRHQFIYVYPVLDQGGLLWLQFIKFLLACMTIALGILMSYMLVVEARSQFYMLIPLVAADAIFIVYLFQRHFRAARHLSSEECVKFDIVNGLDEKTAVNLFADAVYVNPALREAEELVSARRDENAAGICSNDVVAARDVDDDDEENTKETTGPGPAPEYSVCESVETEAPPS